MKLPKPIRQAGAALGGLATLISGCGNSSAKQPTHYTVEGTPVSVAESYSGPQGCLVTILNRDGENFMAHRCSPNALKNAKAKALILSEIQDGDQETITLTGKYVQGGEFVFDYVFANDTSDHTQADYNQ